MKTEDRYTIMSNAHNAIEGVCKPDKNQEGWVPEGVRKAAAASDRIGDVNSTAKGSGARYNGGKPDMSLIPMKTLEDEARVWMYGEKKYARFNWQKGMVWSVPFACMMRHMAAWQAGEDLDPESGLPHLAHISCNVRMLTYFSSAYPEGDDRAKP